MSPAATTKFLESQIKEGATVSQLHRATLSLINLSKQIDSAKVKKLLLEALKKDESLLSIGLAFQTAAKLTGADNLNAFADKSKKSLIHSSA